MKQLNEAIEKDISGEYEDAVEAYEQILSQKDPPLDSFINLAFIYWESVTQFYYSNGKIISEKLKVVGIEKYQKTLHEGMMVFPNNPELHFWEKYFLHRGIFEDFSENECIDILNKYGRNESLVPYFFLYLFDKELYKKQRDELLRICLEVPTAKNNWIKSIIE